MATTVNSITTPSGQACDGAITFVSQSPSQLAINNNPTSPYTINFSPLSANVNSLNGKAGTVSLVSEDGSLSFSTSPATSQIKVNAYNATTNSSGLVAQNISGALAWAGAGGPPEVSTVAYVVGAVVIYSGTTYLCLTPQAIGSPIPTSDGTNWQSIGGGGSSGSSITSNGATVACDDPPGSSSITLTTPLTNGDITLKTQRGSVIIDTTTDGNKGLTIATLDTISRFEATDIGGVSGQITFISADSVYPATVSIGGTINNTGLYVSNTQLLFNNVPVGGGNWSYKGAFNTTANTTYALNDVVFDSVTTTQTYICILAYTTATPYPAPSINPTNWKLFATNASGGGGAGSSITAGSGATSATVSCDATGLVTSSCANIFDNVTNNITVQAGNGISIGTGAGGYNVTTGDTGVLLLASGAIIGAIKVGGDPLQNNTGLYVTETLLQYNGVNVIQGAPTSITNGTAPTNGTVSVGSTGAVTLTSAGNVTTNCVDVVLNASNNVAIEPTNFLICQTTGTNPGQFVVGGTANATGLYVSNTQLLYNNVPISTASITGTSGVNVATVSCATGSVVATATGAGAGINLTGAQGVTLGCGLAQGSLIVRPNGAINLTATDAAGTNNNITLQTGLPAGGSSGGTLGNIVLESGGDINGSSTGVISLVSTDSTNPGRITIGGAINDVGLYIANNQFVYFNNRIFPGQQTFFKPPYNWDTGTAYFPNDIVTQSDGFNYICQVTNSNSAPTSANPNWRALAVNPAVSTPTIQSGLAVPGYTTTAGVSVASTSSQILIKFLPPAGASLTHGGGTTTFTGTIEVQCNATKIGSASWVGVQMWDRDVAGSGGNVEGNNSTSSFSTPIYFPTAIPIAAGDGLTTYTTPLITASIVTTPGTAASPTTPTNYSIGMIITGVGVQFAGGGATWTGIVSGSVETVFALVNGGTF